MGNPNQPRGPDGRWIKGGGGLVAVLVAVLALGPGTSAGAGVSGGTSSGSAGTSARSGSSQVRAVSRDAGRVAVRLQRLGKKVDQVTSAVDTDCAAHATDQVKAFFLEHTCVALFRVLFDVRDGGRPVLRVAVAWVDMPDADLARQYQDLIDRDGTGTVRPLTRDGRRDDTSFDGIAYASARDDATVVIAQAEPVGRANAVEELAESAVDAAASG
jgi:hypothetical protein